MNSLLIRSLDVVLALVGLLLTLPILLVIVLLGWLDTGSPIFAQQRVGRGQRPFTLYKFRTMSVGTAQVATHEVGASAVTPLGSFLRRSKLDELPQLVNVIKGEMSLVGPRPCLPSQHELIAEREALGVFAVRPGVTGLAQVNAIDMSTPARLAKWDARMIAEFTLPRYFRYLLQTVAGGGSGDRIRPA